MDIAEKLQTLDMNYLLEKDETMTSAESTLTKMISILEKERNEGTAVGMKLYLRILNQRGEVRLRSKQYQLAAGMYSLEL